MNMVLSDVDETITVVDANQETFEERIRTPLPAAPPPSAQFGRMASLRGSSLPPRVIVRTATPSATPSFSHHVAQNHASEHWRDLFRFRLSIVPDVTPSVIAVTLWSVLVCAVGIPTGIWLPNSIILATVVGTPDEESQENLRQALNLLAGFPVAVKHHLRNETEAAYTDLVPHIDHMRMYAHHSDENLRISKDIPLDVLNHLQAYLCVAKPSPVPVPIYSGLVALTDTFSQLVRIKGTPIPAAYAISVEQSLVVYLLALPFQFIPSLAASNASSGWLTVPLVFLASFVMLGVQHISNEIEDPFGIYQHDLPLDDYCDDIRKFLAEVDAYTLGQTGAGKSIGWGAAFGFEKADYHMAHGGVENKTDHLQKAERGGAGDSGFEPESISWRSHCPALAVNILQIEARRPVRPNAPVSLLNDYTNANGAQHAPVPAAMHHLQQAPPCLRGLQTEQPQVRYSAALQALRASGPAVKASTFVAVGGNCLLAAPSTRNRAYKMLKQSAPPAPSRRGRRAAKAAAVGGITAAPIATASPPTNDFLDTGNFLLPSSFGFNAPSPAFTVASVSESGLYLGPITMSQAEQNESMQVLHAEYLDSAFGMYYVGADQAESHPHPLDPFACFQLEDEPQSCDTSCQPSATQSANPTKPNLDGRPVKLECTFSSLFDLGSDELLVAPSSSSSSPSLLPAASFVMMPPASCDLEPKLDDAPQQVLSGALRYPERVAPILGAATAVHKQVSFLVEVVNEGVDPAVRQ
ncbi:hypothetical protein HDU82_001850 [Entophlyctis luteolus]|nr:hypothetical protein HDU82_001850 [Entophlyctis luteolus]